MSEAFHAAASLSPEHRDLLQRSGISVDVANHRGYRTVYRKVDLSSIGFSRDQQRVPGLLIPVWSPWGEIENYQLRPNEPRIRDGKPLRYETPARSRMTLDVPPDVRGWIGDPRVPLFVTEGIRKADSAASIGLCCVALLGVWNWRGTNEAGGSVALPGWEAVALKGRRVYLVFDSDVTTKRPVYEALKRLKAFLESRGACVWVVYLPSGANGEKAGLDDFLADGHGVDDLIRLAVESLRPPSVTESEEDKRTAIPYERTPDGLVWMKRNGEDVAPVRLTTFNARIIASTLEDDGAETRRSFTIDASVGDRVARFDVPAERFGSLNWATEKLGVGALVYPGQTLREHARTAIQLLSLDAPDRKVYGHLGWRYLPEVGWAYLHAGGAVGPSGVVDGIEVNPPPALAHFLLPPPPADVLLIKAVRASLGILVLAPDRITIPGLASVYRAALDTCDFSMFLAGGTGLFKTAFAALLQSHWGADLDASHLPASWASTENALELLAFAAKDCLLTVDDFAPIGSDQDVSRLHAKAERLLRAQGNNSGRGRLRADLTERPARPPRGMILATGEDVPRGASVRARLGLLDLAAGDIKREALGPCQRDAETGSYAAALSAFVAWVAPQRDVVVEMLRADTERFRDVARGLGSHARTPTTVGSLAAGWAAFLRFAEQTGAVSSSEAQALWARCWVALGEMARRHRDHLVGADPAARFVTLLRSAMGDAAHVAGDDGGTPLLYSPAAWGWRCRERGSGPNVETYWEPQGRRIGWLKDGDLYLDPTSALAVARDLAGKSGDPLTVTPRALHRLLAERSLLMARDVARETLSVRRTLEGRQRDVLFLAAETLAPREGHPTDPTTSVGGHRAAAPSRDRSSDGASETDVGTVGSIPTEDGPRSNDWHADISGAEVGVEGVEELVFEALGDSSDAQRKADLWQ